MTIKTRFKELKSLARDLNVLYVEDEERVNKETSDFLSNFFHYVENCFNGKEGLSKYKAGSFDLIITDIRMPKMDGIELVKHIKAVKEDQKIIITSAHDDSEYLLELINLGVSNFILKPFASEKLVDILVGECKVINNEQEIEKYRSNLESIFQSFKEAIISLDSDLKVIAINKSAQMICSFNENEIKGKKIDEISTFCDTGCLKIIEEAIKSGETKETEMLKCNNSNNPDQFVSVSVYPILERDKRVSGVFMILKDETKVIRLEKELETVKRGSQQHHIIGNSTAIKKIHSLIENLADIDTTVLITGESGTGKELIADAIHYTGVRKDKKLVKVNCAALPENLLESELFGHVKGAFTGAVSNKAGRFEIAEGGTILLDEIGDLPLNMQIKLLRVLQTKEFEKVGATKGIKVDVRIMTATNRVLTDKIESGEFREDLYYRLKVVEIHVPSLRERPDDITLLIEHLLECYNKKFHKMITGITGKAMKIFLEYPWPGNIRELEHALEHAFVVSDGSLIEIKDLPNDLQKYTKKEYPLKTLKSGAYGKGYLGLTSDQIQEALEKTGWNKAKAARMLGVARKTIQRKVTEYNLKE